MTKVDIFSGFLGAGKTTLIKKLITEGYDTKNIVLIENEFGEIGVDTGFLRDSGIQINEMVAGCICCTLVGDFGKALNEVVEQYNPDRILIEPSGVGKLSDVIIAVQDLHNDNIELNAFTTVVDAKRYKMYMDNFGEFFANQVEHAGTIFLSHQQGMSGDELDAIVKDIRTLNADANIVTTDWDQLDGAKMLAVMEEEKTLNAELDKLREEAYEELEAHEHEHEHEHGEHCHHHHDHDHDDECGCGHHHHHHHHHGHDADEVFDEIGAQTSNKYTKAEIEEILDSLDECGEVLRAKGIVENADGGWLEFDYVPGEGEVRETEAEATGMVAVIGTRLNKEKLQELFKLS
ncbi:MAG: GTP-binding protein [Mogibacterium sp.]|nr:GTP-binding protein [Mogibacterium sp.]